MDNPVLCVGVETWSAWPWRASPAVDLPSLGFPEGLVDG